MMNSRIRKMGVKFMVGTKLLKSNDKKITVDRIVSCIYQKNKFRLQMQSKKQQKIL